MGPKHNNIYHIRITQIKNCLCKTAKHTNVKVCLQRIIYIKNREYLYEQIYLKNKKNNGS